MYRYAVRTEGYSASSEVQTKGLNLVETKIKYNSDSRGAVQTKDAGDAALRALQRRRMTAAAVRGRQRPALVPTELVATGRWPPGCCNNVREKPHAAAFQRGRRLRSSSSGSRAASQGTAQRGTFKRFCSTARTRAVPLRRCFETLASCVGRRRPWTRTSSTLLFSPGCRWTKCSCSRTATTTAVMRLFSRARGVSACV